MELLFQMTYQYTDFYVLSQENTFCKSIFSESSNFTKPKQRSTNRCVNKQQAKSNHLFWQRNMKTTCIQTHKYVILHKLIFGKSCN